MLGKRPGRYLAPVALVAVTVAVILVVNGRVQGHHPSAAAHHSSDLPTLHAVPKRRFYVIKPGDSLSSISVKTHVPVATLEALNPSLDPNALQAGHRIRLRR